MRFGLGMMKKSILGYLFLKSTNGTGKSLLYAYTFMLFGEGKNRFSKIGPPLKKLHFCEKSKVIAK